MLKKEILPSFAKLEAGRALRPVHTSGSKVEAVEDTVTFSPALFRLQKSIMLTRPVEPLFSPLG